MKRLLLNALLAPFILVVMPVGCEPRATVRKDFVDCLMQMNAVAIKKVSLELEIIDERLYTTEEKLMKLEQVVTPALKWIENEKVRLLEKFESGSWSSHVTQADLDKFKNDRYQIATLKLSVHEIGTPNQKFSVIILVMDLATREKGDWQEVESELKTEKSALEQRRDEKIVQGKLSASVLKNVIERLEDWKVQKINDGIYSINGAGLGMVEELTEGKWLYYKDSKEITPVDTRSWSLWKKLSCIF